MGIPSVLVLGISVGIPWKLALGLGGESAQICENWAALAM